MDNPIFNQRRMNFDPDRIDLESMREFIRCMEYESNQHYDDAYGCNGTSALRNIGYHLMYYLMKCLKLCDIKMVILKILKGYVCRV